MLCIYHGNCADGFGAAWVVRKALGVGVEFYAGIYQQPAPDVENKDVMIVDFSYKRPVMQEIIAKAKSVTVLDHHKTAIEDLANLDGANVVFDLERSGATITWDYFYPGQQRPQLLNHIEDRDLWRLALPKTREIQANLFSYPYDFRVWDELMTMDTEWLVKEGSAIERKHFKDIDELLKVVSRRMVIGGYNVPVANLPYTFSSDAGHKMSKNEPFAACYYDTPGGRCFSLRSNDNGVDVSSVAKQYGGGGHRNAAGFTIAYDKAVMFELSTSAKEGGSP